MDKRKRKLKIKFRIIFIAFFSIVFLVLLIILYCAYNKKFGIAYDGWIDIIFNWISSVATIFLGIIAYWQNERFKIEADVSAELSELKNREYQNQLLEVNNRIMKLEENKEYTYIAFVQGPVFVGNINSNIQMKGKTYTAAISNSGKKFDKGTVFVFQITCQTDVPLRCFQIKHLKISYEDYGNDGKSHALAKFDKGGFVASPIIEKGEIVNYVLAVNELEDLAENVPKGMEINLVITMEVISVFNRTVEQEFLVRLQRNNPIFNSGDSKNAFWNYCYESEPKRC